MSILGTIEADVSKVGGFIAKEITAAENLLGAKTGNAKLNLVVTAVTAGLNAAGINVTAAETEIKSIVNAMVALFNATGLFTQSGSSTPAAPAA